MAAIFSCPQCVKKNIKALHLWPSVQVVKYNHRRPYTAGHVMCKVAHGSSSSWCYVQLCHMAWLAWCHWDDPTSLHILDAALGNISWGMFQYELGCPNAKFDWNPIRCISNFTNREILISIKNCLLTNCLSFCSSQSVFTHWALRTK